MTRQQPVWWQRPVVRRTAGTALLLALLALGSVSLPEGQAMLTAGLLRPVISVSVPPPLPALSRQLRFVPLADGREAVLAADTGGLVRMLAADKADQSFLRVTVRILMGLRQRRGVAVDAPFTLVEEDSGLALVDDLTTSHIPLRAFGATTLANIMPLLTAPAAAAAALPPACTRLEC